MLKFKTHPSIDPFNVLSSSCTQTQVMTRGILCDLLLNAKNAASVSICGGPNAAIIEHMMTGIPSRQGWCNPGYKTEECQWEKHCWLNEWLLSSQQTAAGAGTSLESETCPQMCVRPQAGFSFSDRFFASLFPYCWPQNKVGIPQGLFSKEAAWEE